MQHIVTRWILAVTKYLKLKKKTNHQLIIGYNITKELKISFKERPQYQLRINHYKWIHLNLTKNLNKGEFKFPLIIS